MPFNIFLSIFFPSLHIQYTYFLEYHRKKSREYQTNYQLKMLKKLVFFCFKFLKVHFLHLTIVENKFF